jgi:type II secretion system protein H
MRARPNSQSGFTLIELMVVLILIGIFSALMFAEMRGTYEDSLLRSTARKIIGAADLAASKAVTVNRAHFLFLEPDSSRLRIRMEQESAGEEQEALDSRIKVEVRSLNKASDEESDDVPASDEPKQRDANKIEFFPDGTADAREITLRDRMGIELILRINPVTGRIRIVQSEAAR